MTVVGDWHLTIKTPIGAQHVTLHLWDQGGSLAGAAEGTYETVALRDPTLVGNRLTWSQSITKPLRLNLTFDVTIDGDSLSGTSRAGRLPRSKVTGVRDAPVD
jgi:hypothetical protein